MVLLLGFPGGSDGKESALNLGDRGLIPVLQRSPGEGNSYPLQYSGLENSMDRGAWQATVHGVAKSWTRLSDWTELNWITLQYCIGFCHTLTWISHGCTCVLHSESPSHLFPHPIPQGCLRAPALSTLSHASNLDWWSISHMIICMFQCYFLKSSHPLLPPLCPKVCSLRLYLLCCPACRIISTVFLKFMYMR